MALIKCKQCGTEIESQDKWGNFRVFCNRSCSMTYRMTNDEEFRTIMRNATIRRNKVDNPSKGLEARRKMSLSMSKRMREDNPMKYPEVSEKFSKMMTQRNLENWKNPAYAMRMGIRGRVGYREDLGHIVKSSWEANFARILRFLGLEYNYEPGPFLTEYGHYFPDFKLKEFDIYFEVKGHWWDETSKNRFEDFAENHNAQLVYKEEYSSLKDTFKPLISTWEMD